MMKKKLTTVVKLHFIYLFMTDMLCFNLVPFSSLTYFICLQWPYCVLEHNLFLWVTHNVIRVNNVLDCVAKYKNMNLWWQVKCDDSLQSFKQCNTSIKCCRDGNFIFRFGIKSKHMIKLDSGYKFTNNVMWLVTPWETN